MDEFIDLLKTFDDNKDVIDKFEEKINQPIKYTKLLNRFKFTKKWFAKLDYILTQLGYRALDADIQCIRGWLVGKLDTIHINKIDAEYNFINELQPQYYSKYLSYIECDFIEITTYLIHVKPDEIFWQQFSRNESDIAVKYCLEHPDKIDWDEFSQNENDIAVHRCVEIRNEIYMDSNKFSLNKNSIAVEYLIENYEMDCTRFSGNENPIAVEYLIEQHPDEIDWDYFSENKVDMAVHYCLEHLDKIEWVCFSANENSIAVNYLIEHANNIDWESFSKNKNPIAVGYCLEHPDKIDWDYFSRNSADIAVKYCLEHSDKIDLHSFMCNKNILAVKYCIKNNLPSEYAFLLIRENVKNDKIDRFNKLGWLPKSGLIL